MDTRQHPATASQPGTLPHLPGGEGHRINSRIPPVARLEETVPLCGKSPWSEEEPGGLRSVGSQRVGHGWGTERGTAVRRGPSHPFSNDAMAALRDGETRGSSWQLEPPDTRVWALPSHFHRVCHLIRLSVRGPSAPSLRRSNQGAGEAAGTRLRSQVLHEASWLALKKAEI